MLRKTSFVLTAAFLLVAVDSAEAQLNKPSFDKPNGTSGQHVWISLLTLKVCEKFNLNPLLVMSLTAFGKEVVYDMLIYDSEPDILDAAFFILPVIFAQGREDKIIFGFIINLAYSPGRRFEIEASFMRMHIVKRIFVNPKFSFDPKMGIVSWGMSLNYSLKSILKKRHIFAGLGAKLTQFNSSGIVIHGDNVLFWYANFGLAM